MTGLFMAVLQHLYDLADVQSGIFQQYQHMKQQIGCLIFGFIRIILHPCQRQFNPLFAHLLRNTRCAVLDGTACIAQKVGEEGVEVELARMKDDADETKNEAADLLSLIHI